MKNLVTLIGIICFISTSVVAQEMMSQSPFNLRLSTGLSMPMGEFKAVTGEKAGLATPGLMGMLEVTKPITEMIDVTFSTTLAHNDINIYKIEEELSKIISPVNVLSASYYTSWAMAGVQLGHDTFENTRFYFNANLGLLFSSFPDLTIIHLGQSMTQKTESKIALGFGFGAGMQYDVLFVGVRYLTGTPEYSQTIEGSTINITGIELPVSVLLLMMGITF